MQRMSGWKRIPCIPRTGNAVPRAVHEHSIRALAVDKMLEDMRHHAGKGYAEQHAVRFTAELFVVWSKPGIQPEQTNHSQQNFLIRDPGHDLQAALARRCRSAGATFADRDIEARGTQCNDPLMRHLIDSPKREARQRQSRRASTARQGVFPQRGKPSGGKVSAEHPSNSPRAASFRSETSRWRVNRLNINSIRAAKAPAPAYAAHCGSQSRLHTPP